MSEAELSRDEAIGVAQHCFADPVLFCQTFLPHLFSTPIPWVHRGLLAILTGRTAFLSKYGNLDKLVKNFIYKKPDGEVRSLFVRNGAGLQLALDRFTIIMLPRGFSKT